MNSEFPYQLVAFLDKQPPVGEPVYEGKNGWYPQIALKRRFRIKGINEDDLTAKIEQFCINAPNITIRTGDLVKLDRMPVKIIEVLNQDELTAFHLKFVNFLGNQIISKYPDREFENYLPHITAEYNGKMVIDTKQFANESFTIKRVCLIKDTDGEDSVAYHYFAMMNP